MRLLISDSNILIDVEVAGLTRAMFRLRGACHSPFDRPFDKLRANGITM